MKKKFGSLLATIALAAALVGAADASTDADLLIAGPNMSCC